MYNMVFEGSFKAYVEPYIEAVGLRILRTEVVAKPGQIITRSLKVQVAGKQFTAKGTYNPDIDTLTISD